MTQKVVSIISTKARFNKTKIINRKCLLCRNLAMFGTMIPKHIMSKASEPRWPPLHLEPGTTDEGRVEDPR